MAQSIDLPGNGVLALSRDSLIALRTALFRELGPGAAGLLQDAGYAGGDALYAAFSEWLAARGLGTPEEVPAVEFGAQAGEFLRELGWGAIEFGSFHGVATIDSPSWAESDPRFPLQFPGCYYTTGMLADFFGRLAGVPAAVMEVECRSMGAGRCRWLLGNADVMQHLYDEMGRGVPYDEALAG